MNILFVIPNLGLGGAQSFLLRLLSAFPEEHNIFLYDVHPKQKEVEILTNLTKNIKIYSSVYERLEISLSKYPAFFSKILNRLNGYLGLKSWIDKQYFNRILKKKKIQLINSHMYLADSFVFHNCQPSIPKISSFHGCYNLIWDKNKDDSNFANLKKEIAEILNHYNGAIIAAERHSSVFTNFEVKSNLPINKIYYGFDHQEKIKTELKKELNIKPDRFIFGMVARGDITKGWQEAIDAFEILQKENDNVLLILCGGTTYLDDLRIKYKENKDIIFTGNVSNPIDYIDIFHVGMLPTYFPAESLPNTVIEYLYCGKPVIATDWAEIPLMIDFEGEKAGEIIPLIEGKADTEKLYLAMKSYLDDKSKWNNHYVLAKKAFDKFEMKKCVQSYIGFFKEALKNE